MDNINEEFEKYYKFTTNQIQQQQNNQQSPQQSIHTTTTTDFDQESLFGLLPPPNEYYNTNSIPSMATAQFTHSNTNTTNDQDGGYYKHQSDPPLFLEQLMPSTHSDNNMTPCTSTAHFTPNNSNIITAAAAAEPFENQNNNIIYNANTNNTDNNNNFMFSPQQHVIMNDGNVMFPPSSKQHMSLQSTAHSNFQQKQQQTPTKPRQEQDVFNELISLATRNSTSQSDMSSWHVTNAIPYNHTFGRGPPPPSSAEFQRHIEQQYKNNKKNYFNPPPTTNTTITANNNPSSFITSTSRLSQQTTTSKRPMIESDISINSCNRNEWIYELIIAQQPSRARMCGFGDKDRRPISPPPILQLVVTTKYGQIINPETFDASFLVVMCDSCQLPQQKVEEEAFQQEQDTIISSSQVVSFPTITTNEEGIETSTAIKMRNLVGSSVSSATKLYDLYGNLGIFFVFQDVSLRIEGCFRLKFSLVDIGSPYSHHVNTTGISQVLKTIHTDPFMVYTAKKFPGVVQSTALSKCFAKQGIKIPIRKEKTISATARKRQAAAAAVTRNSDEEEEEEDQDDDV